MINDDITLTQFDFSQFDSHNEWQLYLRKAYVRVLFVTDDRFTDTNSAYEYMNGKTLGCTTFNIERALYGNGALTTVENPSSNQPHYSNFRFNSNKSGGGRLIDDFDVIFLFAVSPGNPSGFPDEDLSALHSWMQDGGGIFATGDHSVLGQRIGSRIPRVGSMRKWTSADQVPPGTGDTRIDTNQPDPSNVGQVNGTSTIFNSAQGDEFPQPITWIPYRTVQVGVFQQVRYPHDILCHPTLGAINVMPDHPHEGECVSPSQINMTADVDFVTEVADKDEYPIHNGHQEVPRIIATGRNSSEYLLQKGAVNPYTFNMISVYDGYKVGVGRVVVDSTWHHWYGMNIDGLISAGGDNWEKIGRYFLNIAKYLTPEGKFRERCYIDILDAQFAYPFNEEQLLLGLSDDLFELGASYQETLILRWGKCGVVRFVLEQLCDIKPWLCRLAEEQIIPEFDPNNPRGPGPICLTCPPFETLMLAVLGGVVRGTAEVRKGLQSRFYGDGKGIEARVSVDEIEKMVKVGIAEALDEYQSLLKDDFARTQKQWFSN